MKDIVTKIRNYLMPETVEEVPAKEEVIQNETKKTIQKEYISQGNGPDIEINQGNVDNTTSTYHDQPKLKVFKHPDMNVLVFTPTNFNDTRYIADALKNRRIIVINFEKVETSEQIRVSDFMNGACYVLDGSVKQITKKMSLYVPKGISIEFETSRPQA